MEKKTKSSRNVCAWPEVINWHKIEQNIWSDGIQTTCNTQQHSTKEVSTDQGRVIYVLPCLFFLVDICKDYQNLTDTERRYDYETGDSKCDDTLNGWYRFQGAAGTKMVTTCPRMNRCDAGFPAWLKGDHPTVAEGRVLKLVCIHESGHCCGSFVFIQVKNCGSYYIYNLVSPGICDAWYCSTD